MDGKITGLVLDGDEWFSIRQAAVLAGVTTEAIYKSIERGRLEAREIIETKAISLSDIRRLWPQVTDWNPSRGCQHD